MAITKNATKNAKANNLKNKVSKNAEFGTIKSITLISRLLLHKTSII